MSIKLSEQVPDEVSEQVSEPVPEIVENQSTNNDDPESVIYCGPNLPGGQLSKYIVFTNGIPKHIEQQFEKCPSLNRLFVPVSKFNGFQERLMQSGSAEQAFFNEVRNYYYTKKVK